MPSQVVLVVKNPLANAGDIRIMVLIPGLGRSLGGGYSNPLQYSCLENLKDRGVWGATVHGVAKSWTRVKRLSTHTLHSHSTISYHNSASAGRNLICFQKTTSFLNSGPMHILFPLTETLFSLPSNFYLIHLRSSFLIPQPWSREPYCMLPWDFILLLKYITLNCNYLHVCIYHYTGGSVKAEIASFLFCIEKLLSHVWLFATQWTVAYQALLSMGFSRQEYWSGLPFPSPGDLPDPGIEPRSSTL